MVSNDFPACDYLNLTDRSDFADVRYRALTTLAMQASESPMVCRPRARVSLRSFGDLPGIQAEVALLLRYINASDDVFRYRPSIALDECHDPDGVAIVVNGLGPELFGLSIDKGDFVSRYAGSEIAVGPGAAVDVRMLYRETYTADDSMVLSLSALALGWHVSVDAPAFTIDVDGATPHKSVDGFGDYFFDRPYVGGQHVRIFWRRKRP